jgi:hypothetical protein
MLKKQSETSGRYLRDRVAVLPEIRCTCGRRGKNANVDVLKEYVKRGHEVAAVVRDYVQDQINEAGAQTRLSDIERNKRLRQIEIEGKIRMGDALNQVFNDLGIVGYCCRKEISDAARQGALASFDITPETPQEVVDQYVFNPEEYYVIL